MTSHATTCKWVFCTPHGCWEFTQRIHRDMIQWLNQQLGCVTVHTVNLVRAAMGGSELHQEILLESTGSFFATVEEGTISE